MHDMGPFVNAIYDAPRNDVAPSLVAADRIEEHGFPGVASVLRGGISQYQTRYGIRPAHPMPPGFRGPTPFHWNRALAHGHGQLPGSTQYPVHVRLTVHYHPNTGRYFASSVGFQKYGPDGKIETGFAPWPGVESDDSDLFHTILQEGNFDRDLHNKLLRAWHHDAPQREAAGGHRPMPAPAPSLKERLDKFRARRSLGLARAVNDPKSYATHPEKQWLNTASEGKLKVMDDLKADASRPSNPFGGTLPKVKTLVTLAELGAPAKGEYQRTYETVKSLFGHDVDGVAAWQGVNAALSPRTEYLDHAAAASLITANWLAMGKPSDPDTIRNLIHRVHVFGKLYTPTLAAKTPWAVDPKTKRWSGLPTGQGMTFGGTTTMGMNVERAVRVLANVSKLREAMLDPGGDPGEHLALLSGGGLHKVPNFAISYSAPRQGTALDMWMSHLLFHPNLDNIQDYSDVLSQVKHQLSDPSDLNDIEKKAKQDYPVRSELVRALMKVPNLVVNVARKDKSGKTSLEPIKVAKFIQELNTNLISDTPVYMAYKHAVAEAAKQLKWNLAQVQESVWTGIVALAAAKSAGIPVKKIQEYLTADAVRKGWQNHEAFVFPGVVDAYGRAGTDPAAVRQLEQRTLEGAAKRSRPGILPISDPAHLRRIAAFVPPSNVTGKDAAGPIRRAIIQRLTQEGLFDPNTGRMRMQRVRRALKMATPQEFQALFNQIKANPRDAAHWGIAADALDELGTPAAANLFRLIFNHWNTAHPTTQPWEFIRHPEANRDHNYGVNPQVDGLLHGVPVTTWPLVNAYTQQDLDNPTKYDAWGVYVGGSDGGKSVASVILPPDEGIRLTHELQDDPNQHKLIYPGQEHYHSSVTDAKKRLPHPGEPPVHLGKMRLAQYDMPLDFVSALSRAVSADQRTFADHLRHVLAQSGIQPHEVSPAVHDYGGAARASVLAAGSYKQGHQTFPHTGTAWAGLLGRQPGMLTFNGGAAGPDSVYRFAHPDADAVRTALDRAGVKNRVLVPQDKSFHVFVYDKGRRYREGVAQALTMLGVPAEEWRGTGTPIGGNTDDMGREQYRGVINRSEAAQAGPVQMAFGAFRGGNYAATFPRPPGAPWHWSPPRHYQALNDWFEKNKSPRLSFQSPVKDDDGMIKRDGDGIAVMQTHEVAKVGNNRIMHRDPEDGSLHVRLHTTDVVTAHPDGTYTLRAGPPGYRHVGWRTPMTHFTQAYFAPQGASWKMPGFFNGIRIDGQGRPIHTISGVYDPFIKQMVEDAHNLNTREAKKTLADAIRTLSPSWARVRGPDTTALPRVDRQRAQALHEMLMNRGYDPDSSAAAELAEVLHTGDKPYTAHAVRMLHGLTTYEEPARRASNGMPFWQPYVPLVQGEVGGVPLELSVPQNYPGEFMDPRWRVSFGMGPRPHSEFPYKVPLMTHVPQEIGRGILHEIDSLTTNSALMRLKYKKALKNYSRPGLYRFPTQE
jgi:hypothetical protein